MPSAEASANGPRQAGIEGQGGSDLTQAFKILSLHLPRVLGASAIAPRRLLTSAGSAGVGAPDGASPYSQVFQALLQSLGGGWAMSADGGYGPSSLSSLFGGGADPAGGDGSASTSRPPAPNISFGTDQRLPDVFGGGQSSASADTTSATAEDYGRQDTQYI